MHPDDDEDVIALGPDDEDDWYEDDAPGPDDRDLDLLDGTWEEKYYAGRAGGRDWNTIALAIALLLVIALVLPGVLVVIN